MVMFFANKFNILIRCLLSHFEADGFPYKFSYKQKLKVLYLKLFNKNQISYEVRLTK